MKLLVLGAGAREHALAWKLTRERSVSEVLCAPGNAGIARLARTLPVALHDPAAVASLVEREQVDLTIVGPEQPLSLGIANLFHRRGLPLFGPTREAAEIESSKAFAKDFMHRRGVPTANYVVCHTETEALASARSGQLGFPLVLKADGLAAGKGVVVAQDLAPAEATIRKFMVDRSLGEAGARVVLEECLTGPEVSYFVISDGQRTISLPTAQDHKRVFDQDRGPNTGGMGAFAPSPLIDRALEARILDEIIAPVVAGLRDEGREFRGFLYAGLMLTPKGPKVIEFNARMGDPETQVVLPMIDADLAPLLAQAAAGRLDTTTLAAVLPSLPQPHVGVVLASGGYPGPYETGKRISGLDEVARMDDVMVFHAGTALKDGDVVTAGGRVLTVVGRGRDYASAIARAYEGVRQIRFEGMHARTDIGAKALGAARISS